MSDSNPWNLLPFPTLEHYEGPWTKWEKRRPFVFATVAIGLAVVMTTLFGTPAFALVASVFVIAELVTGWLRVTGRVRKGVDGWG